MSVFTKENFSYPKVFTVLGTGLAFLLMGFLFDSPKGYFVGFFATLIGTIYLFCRVFVDLRLVGRIIMSIGLIALVGGGSFLTYSELDSSKTNRLDEAGLVWTSTPFGKKSTVNELSVNSDGNIFVVGYYDSKNNDYKAAFGELSPDGKLLWKNNKNSADFTRLQTVEALRNGGAILAGTEGNVTKINSEGDILWSRNYGMLEKTRIQYLKDIAVFEDGRIVVVGYVYQDTHSPNGERGYVALLASNGDLIWEKMLGTKGDMELSSIAIINDETFATVGYSNETGKQKAIIKKISVTGQTLATLELGGDFFGHANDVFISEQGQMYVGGSVESSGNGVSDMALYKVDKTIKTSSLTRYVGRFTGRHSVNAINQDNSGQIILAGGSRQVKDVHTAAIFNVDNNNQPVSGWHDPFVNGGVLTAMTILPDGGQVLIENRYNAYPSNLVALRNPSKDVNAAKIIVLK